MKRENKVIEWNALQAERRQDFGNVRRRKTRLQAERLQEVLRWTKACRAARAHHREMSWHGHRRHDLPGAFPEADRGHVAGGAMAIGGRLRLTRPMMILLAVMVTMLLSGVAYAASAPGGIAGFMAAAEASQESGTCRVSLDMKGDGSVSKVVTVNGQDAVDEQATADVWSVPAGENLLLQLQAGEGSVIGKIFVNGEAPDESDVDQLLGQKTGELTLEELEDDMTLQIVFLTLAEYEAAQAAGSGSESAGSNGGDADVNVNESGGEQGDNGSTSEDAGSDGGDANDANVNESGDELDDADAESADVNGPEVDEEGTGDSEGNDETDSAGDGEDSGQDAGDTEDADGSEEGQDQADGSEDAEGGSEAGDADESKDADSTSTAGNGHEDGTDGAEGEADGNETGSVDRDGNDVADGESGGKTDASNGGDKGLDASDGEASAAAETGDTSKDSESQIDDVGKEAGSEGAQNGETEAKGASGQENGAANENPSGSGTADEDTSEDNAGNTAGDAPAAETASTDGNRNDETVVEANTELVADAVAEDENTDTDEDNDADEDDIAIGTTGNGGGSPRTGDRFPGMILLLLGTSLTVPGILACRGLRRRVGGNSHA